MKSKKFFAHVEADSEFDDVPGAAVFEITSVLAAEIIRFAALVTANDLCSVERFNYEPTWYESSYEDIDDVENDLDAKIARTDCDCLAVSAQEFWFSASLKNSSVSFQTEFFPLSSLAELIGDCGVQEKPLQWKAQGNANEHVISNDANWFATIKMNGEMHRRQQEAWLDSITQMESPRPRVLVVVSGGVADYVADEGVDIELFDRDNFEADKTGTAKAPRSFEGLAWSIEVPFESRFEEIARASSIRMTFDQDLDRYRWESDNEGISQPGSFGELQEWQDACVKNGLIPAMSSAYADSIIGADSERYDALEIHGVRRIENEPEGLCEVDDENPDFYSVYVHLKTGGVDSVGDFQLLPDAEGYAEELAKRYGWAVKINPFD